MTLGQRLTTRLRSARSSRATRRCAGVRRGAVSLATCLAAGVTVLAAGCGTGPAASASAGHSVIVAVGAENQYANVISQIGGRYVRVTAIESNPNTDPHTFEVSPSVVQLISSAQLVVQNGLGYDGFMNQLESAAPNPSRKIIDVQTLFGLPDGTPNPHLWYSPATMPAVARKIAADLSALQPAHRRYFAAHLRAFDRSLRPWLQAIAKLRAAYPRVPVAVTEPVGDALLQAVGASNLTPFGLQADVMKGIDPSPQDVALQDSLLAKHRVRVLLYNQQVVDALTGTFLAAAGRNGIPVVGVYETMPRGFNYQGWMLAETRALFRAVASGKSEQRL